MFEYLVRRYRIFFTSLFLLLFSLYTITSGAKGLGRERIAGSLVFYLIRPIQSILTYSVVSIKKIGTRYIYLVDIEEENEHLKKMVDRLSRENEDLREKALFGERVKEYLDFKEDSPLQLDSVRVIGIDPSSLYYTVIIDKGRAEGIEKNMAAITPRGVVGRVLEVYTHTSKLLLIVDPNSAVDAIVQRNRVRGIVEGRGRNTLILKYVNKGEDVVLGGEVLTSGLNGIFPKGFPIGFVTKIEEGKDDFFKHIELKPVVDLQRIEELFIITQRKGFTVR